MMRRRIIDILFAVQAEPEKGLFQYGKGVIDIREEI